MKKFYEIPVVEITVFDVEDIITASAVSTLDIEGEELATFKQDAEAKYASETNSDVFIDTYSAYIW